MAPEECNSTSVKFFCSDHSYFVLFGKIEIVLAVDLAAQSDLQERAFQDQIFLDGPAKRRAMRVAAAEVFVPQIVVRVELNDADRAMALGDRAKKRQAQRMVTADGYAARASLVERLHLIFHTLECILNRQWVHGEIAIIGD